MRSIKTKNQSYKAVLSRRIFWEAKAVVLIFSVFFSLFTSTDIVAQAYPYALGKLEYKSDPLIEELFKKPRLKELRSGKNTVEVLYHLDSLLASSQLNNKQTAVCLAIKGTSLVYSKQVEEAFPYYKSALEHLDNLAKDDVAYSFVHGSYGAYMAYYEVHDIAIPHLKKALPGLASLNRTGTFKERGIYEQIIRSFRQTEQIDSVRYYRKSMINTAKSNDCKNIVSNLHNNIGLALTTAEEYKEALYHFNESLTWADTTLSGGLFTYVNALESRSHVLVKQDQTDQAIKDLKYVYRSRQRLNRPNHSMQALSYLINYLVKAERELEALQWVKQESVHFKFSGKTPKRGAEVYLTVAKLYENLGNQKSAQRYINVYNQHLANLYNGLDRDKSNPMLNAYMIYRNKAEEQERELELIEKEKLSEELSNTKVKSLLIGIVLLLLMGSIYAIGRLRVLRREKKILLEKEQNKTLQLNNEKLANELKHKEQDLKRIAADSKIRTRLKKEFLGQLENLSTFQGTDLRKHLQKLIHDIDHTVHNQEQLSELQQQIDTINASFEDDIQKKIPGITAQEVKLCGLIKIGMSNQDIAKVMYKQDSTIRSYKYRLKKKASLESVKELEQMVRAI